MGKIQKAYSKGDKSAKVRETSSRKTETEASLNLNKQKFLKKQGPLEPSVFS
jgi:hypothetical protein